MYFDLKRPLRPQPSPILKRRPHEPVRLDTVRLNSSSRLPFELTLCSGSLQAVARVGECALSTFAEASRSESHPTFFHPSQRLVRDCYPKAKLLPSLAPEFKPNSQELSRLTYVASNKPGRLRGIGEELDKRARQSTKAGYNLRHRA